MTQFSQYTPTITEQQVKDYLLLWKQKGHNITTSRPTVKNGWAVELPPDKWIGVQPHPHAKGFWCLSNTLGRITGPKGTINELISAFENSYIALNKAEHKITLDQLHLEQSAPLSTWIKINTLVGDAVIHSIHDCYAKDQTLANLLLLSHLGTKFDPRLRILTTKAHKLTSNCLNKFNEELNIQAQINIRHSHGDSHPRLIFLDDGRCLELTFSLDKENTGTIFTVENKPKLDWFENGWNDSSNLSENSS